MERQALQRAADLAAEYIDGLADRPVGPPVDVERLRLRLGGPLPEGPTDPVAVIESLAREADPGIVASAGPRYFGFVVGGSLPAALAADWLTSAWDQNNVVYVASPAGSVIEETAGRWLLELLGLPAGASVGFTTGATGATFTALAAARNAVLAAAGWDVEARGLQGAPQVRVIVGEEAHATVLAALRMLGLGADTALRIPADGQGRMRADALRDVLATGSGPTIVSAQAGNVNTGAFDPLDEVVGAAHEAGAWVHVDGAFGLWAAASDRLRHLVAGMAGADSWATDAHKWLNVPYDCGVCMVADPAAHRRAMSMTASYIMPAAEAERDPFDWVPEASRRARATPVYAAVRSLGRTGVASLVDRCCALASRLAERLGAAPGVTILNDVVLNQVLVRFGAADAGDGAAADELTRAVIAAVQRDGTCWVGGTTWHGMAAMRVSVSGWRTTAEDIDRSADAILRCYEAVTRPAEASGFRS